MSYIRPVTPPEAESQRDFTTFRHFHDSFWHQYYGSLTIAIRKRGGDLYVGFAVCSPKDNFCRRRGRKLAQENAGTLVLQEGWAEVEAIGFSLKEVIFYALRRAVGSPETAGKPFTSRWRKALGVMAAYTPFADYGLGERF